MRWFRSTFFTGLLVLLPTVLTLYVLYRIFIWVDGFLKPIIARYPFLDIPGLGFLGVIVIILLAGILVGNLLGRTLYKWFEGGVERIPIVRGMYVAIKQVSEVFLKQDRTEFKEVVLVEIPHSGMHVLGLVTSTGRFAGADGKEQEFISVFLPSVPNPTTGFFVMVPRGEVVPSKMSVEDAMKMLISGGAVVPPGHREGEARRGGAAKT